MIYPTMVLIFATLVLIGMLMLVLVFVNIFAQLGGDLLTLTAWVVVLGLPARQLVHRLPDPLRCRPGSGGRSVRSKAAGSADRIKLKIPMKIGQVVLKVTLARFSRTLSTLIAAGVDIIKALEITGQTSGNWVIEEALADVRARVHEGAHRDAAVRERGLPANGLAHGQDR